MHSGRVPVADMREPLAGLAASLDGKSGRAWRNLQDTRSQNVMADREANVDWRDWQRERGDCDVERVLVWPEVDMLIREPLSGTRSLDDFARAFFGVAPGRTVPLTYGFDDIVTTLNRVQPHDGARFLRERLDTNVAGATP